VLFYSLTKTLSEQGVRHHAIRACPDGEGNWYHEIQRVLAPEAIRLLRIKKAWTRGFVQGIRRDLERRHLPLLVDVGGHPEEWQLPILQACTHALLLLRHDKPEGTELWRALVQRAALLPLAEVYSECGGESSITSTTPFLQGSLSHLERGHLAQGKLFDALVERIAALFGSYSLEALEQAKLALAPADSPVHLEPLLSKIDSQATQWTPEMLKRLPAELPPDAPLAVYGRGPGWLYSMLAAYAGQRPFYLFDPRIGWLAPPTLKIGAQPISDELAITVRVVQDTVLLSIRIHSDHLDYLQADQFTFPPLPAGRGIMLDGKIPHWLLTALVRLYAGSGASWIACHQPSINGAIVVYSRDPKQAPGDLIPLPID
jgi:CRISPR-associated protein Csx3